MLSLQTLSPEQVDRLYHGRLCRDFPPDEQRPLERILRFQRQGIYDCLGLRDGDAWVGYAFSVSGVPQGCALLDYYAIRPDTRGQQYGSRFLPLLCQRYPQGFAAEVESPDMAETEEERRTRQRRMDFYLRNGMIRTKIRCLLYDVVYDILCYPGREGQRNLFDKLDATYHALFPDPIYQQKLKYLSV